MLRLRFFVVMTGVKQGGVLFPVVTWPIRITICQLHYLAYHQKSFNMSFCFALKTICVASLQKGPHVAKIKSKDFLWIFIEQVMTNLLKK